MRAPSARGRINKGGACRGTALFSHFGCQSSREIDLFGHRPGRGLSKTRRNRSRSMGENGRKWASAIVSPQSAANRESCPAALAWIACTRCSGDIPGSGLFQRLGGKETCARLRKFTVLHFGAICAKRNRRLDSVNSFAAQSEFTAYILATGNWRCNCNRIGAVLVESRKICHIGSAKWWVYRVKALSSLGIEGLYRILAYHFIEPDCADSIHFTAKNLIHRKLRNNYSTLVYHLLYFWKS